MPHIPGLRSPYVRVGRLVYFARMLDKIRLHERSALPADYVKNLGDTNPAVFDARLCRFLRVPFAQIQTHTLANTSASDAELLEWVEQQGGRRTDEECEIFCAFLSKRGWRDSATKTLEQRASEPHVASRPIACFFDYIDFDEGRDPLAARAWE